MANPFADLIPTDESFRNSDGILEIDIDKPISLPDFGGDTQNRTAQAALAAASKSPLATVIPDFEKKVVGLAQTESSLGINNFSPTGPKGPFQFAKATAKDMGLDTSDQNDERFDPEKSAQAAVKYLETLYSQFGNEQDTFTAYNFGPTALRQSKSGTRQLTDEAANYYGKVVANTETLFNQPLSVPRETQTASTTHVDNPFADLIPREIDPVAQGEANIASFGLKRPQSIAAQESPVRGAMEQLQQGLTLQTGDEAQAGIIAGVEFILGQMQGDPVDISESFKRNLGEIRSRQEQFQQQNPVLSAIAQGVGGALPAVASGGALQLGKAGAGVGRQIAEQATLGAAVGGTAAAGGAESNRLARFGEGALLGAGVGSVIPGAVGAVQGVRNVASRLGAGAQEQAQRKVQQAFQRDEIGIERAASEIGKLGDEAVLADVGGQNVRGLVDSLSNLPGKQKQRITTFLENRQLGRNDRVTDDINNLIADPENFQTVADDLIKIKQTVNKPLYDRAYKQDIPVTDDMVDLLERPAFVKAYKNAKRIAAGDGRQIEQIIYSNGKIESIPNSIATESMDTIKRGLDDQISGLLRRGKKNEARIAQNSRTKFLDMIDSVNPDYATARNTASDLFSLENALEDGKKFLTKDSALTSRQISKLSEDQKDVFRVGAAKAIRDKIVGAPDGVDAHKRIFGNDLVRERVRSIFPDKESFKDFSMAMHREQVFSQTRQAVAGNSKTIERAFANQDLSFLPVNIREKIIGFVIRKAYNQIKAPPEEVANEISKILLNKDINFGDVARTINAMSDKSSGEFRNRLNQVATIIGSQQVVDAASP